MRMTTNVEPKHFKEAMKHRVWRESMSSEIEVLERQHTWDLQELPTNKKALGTFIPNITWANMYIL